MLNSDVNNRDSTKDNSKSDPGADQQSDAKGVSSKKVDPSSALGKATRVVKEIKTARASGPSKRSLSEEAQLLQELAESYGIKLPETPSTSFPGKRKIEESLRASKVLHSAGHNADRVLTSVLEVMVDLFSSNLGLKIPNFGNILLTVRKGKMVQNPSTKQKHKVPAKPVVVFQLSPSLKEKLEARVDLKKVKERDSKAAPVRQNRLRAEMAKLLGIPNLGGALGSSRDGKLTALQEIQRTRKELENQKPQTTRVRELGVRRVVAAFFDAFETTLASHLDLEIEELGRFKIVYRKGGSVKDVQSGEQVTYKDGINIRFYPSDDLLDTVMTKRPD